MTTFRPELEARLAALAGALDAQAGRYQKLVGATDFRSYLTTKAEQDPHAFDALVHECEQTVADLLREGRRLVEEVERLVCALYDVPADLTEEVVAHAVGRAERAA